VREKAGIDLEQFEELAEPELRRALAGNPSVERRRRLESLLARLHDCSPERLRMVRATSVLEQVASAEAKVLLESLAKGAPEARLTQEAKASLARLAKR